MTSNGFAGGVKRSLVNPAFLIFSAATTILTGVLTLLVWLSAETWIAALVPLAPAVVAVALASVRGEKEILKQLLRSLTRVKVGGRWFAISVLLLPLIAVLALLIFAVTGDTTLNFGNPSMAALLAALPLALCNEFGWRGYAPLQVANRKGLFFKSILIGVVWTISISPLYALDIPLLGDVPLYQMVLALIPLSTLMFWLIANTKSLLMPALTATSGLLIFSLLPILPGDAVQVGTFWLVVGFLWIAAVVVAGYYGTDGLDRSINELPPEELPVDWDKIMPKEQPARKRPFGASNGRSKPKSFSSVGRKTRR